jgi:HlyD family secretion protein
MLIKAASLASCEEGFLRGASGDQTLDGIELERKKVGVQAQPKSVDQKAEANLPVPVVRPAGVALPRPPRRQHRPRFLQIVLASLVGAAAACWYWRVHQLPEIPNGIAWSNGRIEAQEIDISTKFAGRIAELLADEGDTVAAGQVVARMDTRDLEASLGKAEAQVKLAEQSLEEARANVAQQKTQVEFAKEQFDRANVLVQRGFTTRETYDQRFQVLNATNAAMMAALARVGVAERALESTQHDVELLKVNIVDNALVAPRMGRIQYKISNVGEVLPSGGKVFTMLDISDVYMDVYLPTLEAGQARVGADARIVLDAYPDFATPGKVSFIATQAQFTPKAVETKSERDKLMFRARVRIDAAFLRKKASEVRTGLPGVAYVLLDPKVAWPPRLQGPGPQ